MCLAIPAKIIGEPNDNGMAEVDILGVKRFVSLMMVPVAKTDDYVLIHAGFAIEIIDQEFAAETLEMFKEMEIPMESELAGEAS